MENLIGFNSGKVIDFYELLDTAPLGSGTFGDVFRVKHNQMNQVRAMKVLKKPRNKNDDKAFEKEVKNEIAILKKLDHPNIVRIYEFFVTKAEIQIIIELIPNGELFDIFATGKKLSENEAAYIMYQLLSSINYCHSLGITHRDLKPENILISEKGSLMNIKVTDFGTAQLIDKDQTLHVMIGSSYYMAPEVLQRNYNNKCDLWSCGVILYMMITFTPPFSGNSENEIYKNIIKGEYNMDREEFKKCSKEMKDFLARLLEYNPTKRMSAEDALNHDWFNVTNTNEKFKSDNKKALQRYLDVIVGAKKQSKLQQVATALIFHQLPESSDIKEVFKVFRVFDVNNDGTVTKQEMWDVLCKYFQEADVKKYVISVFNAVDNDKSGTISYGEFARACIDKNELVKTEHLRTVFQYFDKDSSGTIELEEVRKVFISSNLKINEATLQRMIDEVDKDGNGQIEFKEFEQMMRNVIL